MNNLNSFNNYIQDYLDKKNYNMSEFARMNNISDNLIKKWKTTQCPSIDCVIKIADYFNSSIDYLFGNSNIKSYINSVEEEKFNIRLTVLLKERNYTPYQLSKKLNVAASSAYAWVKESIPNIINIIAISNFFNVSIDYLIGRSDLR